MTVPHILILDNSPRRLGTYWFSKGFRPLECKVSAYHLWEKPRSFALDKFDGLVISGSPASATEDAPWILRELELIEQADRRGIPLLGVCFGAQLLARAYYGKKAVQPSAPVEIGWYSVNRTSQDDVLFEQIPHQFTSFQMHTEEVLPQPEMRILATSAASTTQAFRVGRKPIWGIQFHFEVTPRAGRDLLRKTPGFYEAYGFRYEEMLAAAQPTRVAPQLFNNFLDTLSK